MADTTYTRAADGITTATFDFSDFMAAQGVTTLDYAIRADEGMSIRSTSDSVSKVVLEVSSGRPGRMYRLDVRGTCPAASLIQSSLHRINGPNADWNGVPSSAGNVIGGGTLADYPNWSLPEGGGDLSNPEPAGPAIGGGDLTNTGGTATPPVGSTDTRPRFGIATAGAFATPLELLASLTVVPGSANGAHAGVFTLLTTPGLYGWLACTTATGLTFLDPSGFPGGWNGAGLPGFNAAGGPAKSLVCVTAVINGVAWSFYRTDYPDQCPSPGTTWSFS